MHIHDIYGRFFCNVLPLVLYCGKLSPGKNLLKLVIIHYLSLLCAHAVVVDTQEMVTGYIDDGSTSCFDAECSQLISQTLSEYSR